MPGLCLVLCAQVMDEENYDGPDMTYYFDKPDTPPHGPDDEGGEDKRLKARHPDGFYMG